MFHEWKEVKQEHVLQLLHQLKDLFANQEVWMDWPLATDEKDNEVSPNDPKAIKFCLMGACQFLTEKEHAKPLADYIDCATREYLNDLSGDALIHGKCNYDDELKLIEEAIQDLQEGKEKSNE